MEIPNERPGRTGIWAAVLDKALDPAVSFAVFLCLAPTFPMFARVSGVSHPAYFVLAYLAGSCIRARKTGAFNALHYQRADGLFAIFVVVVLTSWWSAGLVAGYRAVADIVAFGVVPWVVARSLTVRQVLVVLRYTAVIGAVTTIALLVWIFTWQVDAGRERVLVQQDAVYGVFGAPVAFMTVISGAYLLWRREGGRAYLRRGAWIMYALGIVSIVAMGARGMIVAVLLTTTALSIVNFSRPFLKRLLLPFAGIVVAVCAVIAQPAARQEHFFRLAEPILEYVEGDAALAEPDSAPDSIGIRTELYEESWKMFLNEPLTGVGAGRFGLESRFYRGQAVLATPHSSVLHVLAELGVIGLLPFLVLVSGGGYYLLRTVSSDELSVGSGTLVMVGAVWLYAVIFDQFSGSYFVALPFYAFSALLVNGIPRIHENSEYGNTIRADVSGALRAGN
jgi:O-antigen ligase